MAGSIKEQLDSVFDPQSIAFIGASDTKGKWGEFTLRQTLRAGFRGRVYPINRGQKIVQGMQAYPSVLDVPDDVDMAVFVVPAAACIPAMEECVRKGVKAAIVITGGFAETGEAGRALQGELVRVARTGGIRVVGPNGMGVWSATSRLCLPPSFDPPPISGPIAFISQSGMFGGFLMNHAGAKGYGFSRFVSAGNQADLGAADYLEYCDQDPETRVIVFYLEGLNDGRRFVEVARDVIRRKPIVVYKSGRSTSGQRAMLSHTGSLSGSDEVFDAMCRQVGILRVSEAAHAFDVAQALALQPLPSGKRVGIVATGGGFCVTVADQCGASGLEVPVLDSDTQAKIKPNLLPLAPAPINPIDTVGDGRHFLLPHIAEQLASLDYIDGIISSTPVGFRTAPTTHLFVQASEIYKRISTEKKKPIVLSDLSGKRWSVYDLLREVNLPVYDNPADAARAMAALMYFGDIQRRLAEDGIRSQVASQSTEESRAAAQAIIGAARAEGRSTLSEHESKKVLGAYGIPVTKEHVVRSQEELAEVLQSYVLPVAMKVHSPDILHKTEAGLVRLDVGSMDEAVEAYRDLMQRARQYNPPARIDGVLVQEMVTEATECFIGVTQDQQLGPTIAFGLGGIFVEVLKDVSLRIAPLTARNASSMVREIKGCRILEGVRGQPPRDIPAIEDTLLKVSRMAVDLSEEIAELDINPLMVGPEGWGVKAVDALIVLGRSGEQA